jgi:hypothetical protein
MSVTFDDNYRNQITISLTVRIGRAINSGELDDDEICEVCSYVTVALDTIKSKEEMTDFLIKMSARWPLFQEILDEENKRNNTLSQIDDMLLNRQIPAAT